MSEEAATANFEQSDESQLPDEEVAALALLRYLEIFAQRQEELLRMAEFVTAREEEIDDVATRAKRLISQQVVQVDENALEKLIELIRALEAEDDESGDFDSEKEKATRMAFAEAVESLPEGTSQAYLESIVRSLSPTGTRFLHSPLLITLVGELEVLALNLASIGFDFRPGAFDPQEKRFTWGEISKHDSLEEFRDAIVEELIDSKFRGSLQKSIEFIEVSFDLPRVNAARSRVAREAVQRRHCLVHNGGLVSKDYLSSLADLHPTQELDDILRVDGPYLADAADSFFLVAYSLVWSLGQKLTGGGSGAVRLFEALSTRTMTLLQEGRYKLVIAIASQKAALKQLAKDPDLEEMALVIQINGWIAHKELGRFDKVADEVESLNVNLLDTRYKLAKAALLDNLDLAHTLASELLARDELRMSHILTWPLLRGVRSRFEADVRNPIE